MPGFDSLKDPVIPDKQSVGGSHCLSIKMSRRLCELFVLAVSLLRIFLDRVGQLATPIRPITEFIDSGIVKVLGSTDQTRAKLEPKAPKRTVLTEYISSAHTDSRGFALGGAILSAVDIAGGICARIHGGLPAVTASVDAVHLLHPFKCGDIAIVSAMLTRAWSSSMEVVVDVECENLQTGERQLGCRAYLTFVALRDGAPARVPPILPTSTEEEERFEAANLRKKARLQTKSTPTDAFGPIMSHYQEVYYQSIDPSSSIVSEKARDLKTAVNVSQAAEKKVATSNKRRHVQKVLGDDKDLLPASPLESSAANLVAIGPQLARSNSVHTMGASYCELVQIVLPQHANTYKITFGGHILKLIEACAHISASRHARSFITTASLDEVRFKRPTYVGDCLFIRSLVSCAFSHSMEIYVSVERQDSLGNRKFTNDAFLTMVAVDEHNKPVLVPELLPQNKKEERIIQQAQGRKKLRDEQRSQVKLWASSFNAQMTKNK